MSPMNVITVYIHLFTTFIYYCCGFYATSDVPSMCLHSSRMTLVIFLKCRNSSVADFYTSCGICMFMLHKQNYYYLIKNDFLCIDAESLSTHGYLSVNPFFFSGLKLSLHRALFCIQGTISKSTLSKPT